MKLEIKDVTEQMRSLSNSWAELIERQNETIEQQDALINEYELFISRILPQWLECRPAGREKKRRDARRALEKVRSL